MLLPMVRLDSEQPRSACLVGSGRRMPALLFGAARAIFPVLVMLELLTNSQKDAAHEEPLAKRRSFFLKSWKWLPWK